MPSFSRRGPRLAQALLIAGTLLLLFTLNVAWYSTYIGNGINNASETLYVSHVQLSGDQNGVVFNGASSFASVYLPGTGGLYLVVAGLVVAGSLVGLVATVLTAARGTPRRIRMTRLVVIAAVVLAASAPVALLALQPIAFCSDSAHIPSGISPSEYGNSTMSPSCGWAMSVWGDVAPSPIYSSSTSGPQSSFFGSQPFHLTSPNTGFALDWGPSIGWYLALVATLLMGIGAKRYRTWSREPTTGGSKADVAPAPAEPASPDAR